MNIREAVDYMTHNVDLYDYISTYYNVSFKRIGGSYQALCPINSHDNKSPSFSIPIGKNYFNCFGCGAKGNIINFVAQYYNCDNKEAIERICKDMSITIDKSNNISSEKQKYLDANKEKLFKYISTLVNDNQEAYKYITETRKLTMDTIKNFKLGATLNNEVIKENNNRVVFPIESNLEEGIFAYAYGYINDASKYNRKYTNDSSNNFFKKSDIFYGFRQSYTHIRKTKKVYVVEGYFDVISMHQSGFKNVLGVLCASLSDNQIETLKRLDAEVIMFLDTDEAGKKGSMSAIPRLLESGLKVKIVRLQTCKDADELCNKHNFDYISINDELTRCIKDAVLFYMEEDILKFKNTVIDMQLDINKKINTLLKDLEGLDKSIYIKHFQSELKL